MRPIAVAIAAAMVMSCGGGASSPSPVPPATATPTPVVRANLTGAWDFVLVGTPAGSILPAISLSLREADGAVSGVLQFAGDTEAPGLKGAISPARVLQMSAEWVALSVAVDADGRSFSGTYVVREDDGTNASFNVRGTKRSDVPVTLIPNDTHVSGRSRVDGLPFTLAAGSRSSIVIGPILAAGPRVDVTLDFGGSYIILGCFGTSTACLPFGGRPVTTTFTIPSALFPAGPLQTSVYFNPNYAQPPGNATGFVRFDYNPQWR